MPMINDFDAMSCKPAPVVKPGEFGFSAIGLEHDHINGMCRGLIEAGATLRYVYDADPEKAKQFRQKFPQVRIAASENEVLHDSETKLVAGAAITSERCDLGIRVMEAGKDYFTDKAPLTTLDQLERAKAAVIRTGRKYMCYYSERLHVESAIFTGQLIERGAIGRVISIAGFGPHRLRKETRPDWFFRKKKYGGILCDIGSHQIEQYLTFAGEEDAVVVASRVGNYRNPDVPELEDFGDCTMTGKNGTAFYFRCDWCTPDGLRTWGDGRTLITGTEGTIEIRKYIDLCADQVMGDHVFLVTAEGEKRFDVKGRIGFPFFGQLIEDCIHRTENAMTQEHCFKAAELGVRAEMQAVRIHGSKTGRDE